MLFQQLSAGKSRYIYIDVESVGEEIFERDTDVYMRIEFNKNTYCVTTWWHILRCTHAYSVFVPFFTDISHSVWMYVFVCVRASAIYDGIAGTLTLKCDDDVWVIPILKNCYY